MTKVTLDAYLFFGGELKVMTWDEAPGYDQPAMKGKAMHATLSGGMISLLGADSPKADTLGTGKISLSLSGTEADKLRTIFDGLSAGGKVNDPLSQKFWGDTFGMLTDKFDVDWMVNISPAGDAAK